MTLDTLLLPYQSEEFTEAWEGFIDMRKGIKAPLTNRAKTIALRKLKTLADTEEDAIAILDQSTMNCWRGLFCVRNQDSNYSHRPDQELL